MKELLPMKKRAAPVKLTEPKGHIAKKKNLSTNQKAADSGRVGVAKSNRIPVANSPAKPASTSFLIASSIFDNDDDTSQLEEEFLNAAKDGDFALVERLLGSRNESLFSIDVRDTETKNTALIWAAKRGHKKIVELLLRHCADVTLRNFEGQTALETASPAIQELLLGSVERGGPHRNLLQAAWQGDRRVIASILKDFQIDINCKNEDGLTPLLLVTRDVQLFEKYCEKHGRVYDPLDVISLLIENRADPCATDPDGRTALHYASTSKAAISTELVQRLLQCSQVTDVQDRRSFMPIHCAAQSGNSPVVVALLDGGTDANVRGYAGATPLHISALNGHDPVCGVLLSRGADVTLVDDRGLTAVEVAKNKKVKATLKQAWAEATEKKETVNQLNPVRPPSRGDQKVVKGILTRSKSFNYGNRRKGEVIFDSLEPTGSCENISKKASLLSDAQKARLAEDRMWRESTDLGTAPFGGLVRGNSKLSPRSQSRSPSRSPPTARKLAPLKVTSPRKQNSRREIKFGPGTKSYDGNHLGKSVNISTSGSGKFQPYHAGLKKCPSDPAKFGGGGSGVPITVLGFEPDEHTQSWRSQGGFPSRKGHFRQGSDPFTSPTPTPSEGGNMTEEFYLRGRSPSHLSMVSVSEDWECGGGNTLSTSPPNRLSPLKTPTPRGGGDSQEEADSRGRQRYPQVLTLERMQITNRQSFSPALVDPGIYPNSKKLLPPTPVHLDHPIEPDPRHPASKDNSPRSDEDVTSSLRCKSVLKGGDFRIEDTQVNSSNDSGLPEDKSSSKSSSVNSSMSTLSNGSPRNQEQASKSSEKSTKSTDKPTKTSNKQEVVIRIDSKHTKSHAMTTRSSANGKENSAGFSKVNARLEHSLSTQEIEDKYLDVLPHSNSASALSSLVPEDLEETSTNEHDRNSGLKSKRNTSFSNVRENTGFLTVDKANTSSSSPGHSGGKKTLDSGKGSSNMNSASGVARNGDVSHSKDLSKPNQNKGSSNVTSSGGVSRNPSNVSNSKDLNRQSQRTGSVNVTSASVSGRNNNLSNSKDVSRQGGQQGNNISAKLKTVAQDNAAKLSAKPSTSEERSEAVQEGKGRSDFSKDTKVVQKATSVSSSVIKPSVSAGSPAKSAPKTTATSTSESKSSSTSSTRQQNPAPVSKTGDRSQSNSNKSEDVVNRARTGQAILRQDSVKPGGVRASQSSGMSSSSSSSGQAQPQVMQLKSNLSKDTKDKSNTSIAQTKGVTSTSASVGPAKMASANASVRTSHVQSSRNNTSASQVAKVIHVQEALDSSPQSTESASSKNVSASSVSARNNASISKSSRPGATSRSISNTVPHRQTSGPITSGARSNSSSRSVSSNIRGSQQTAGAGSNSTNQTTGLSKQTPESAKAGSSHDVNEKKGRVDNNKNKPTVLSSAKDKDNGTSDKTSGYYLNNNNKSGPRDKVNASKPKSSYTTTMTVKLSDDSNSTKNVPSTVQSQGEVSPEIFNQGEAPVAPPRRKRSTGSRPASGSSYSSNGSESPPAEFGDNYVVSKTGVLTSLSVNTLKHGVTPVSSANFPSSTGISTKDKKSPPARPPLPVSKQVAVKSSDNGGVINIKPSSHKETSGKGIGPDGNPKEDHTGPKIVDPFESLNERRMKEFEEMMAREREAAAAEKKEQPPRSGKSRVNNAVAKKSDAKGKGIERQGSAGKGRKTRNLKGGSTTGEESKKRIKSSKRRRKGKKKEENTTLTENADDANVALIGGIGWHIETGCNDRTDVQAVTLKDSSDEEDDDDVDEEESEENDEDEEDNEINITVHSNFLQGRRHSEVQTTGKGRQRELTILVSGTIPGQVSDSDNNNNSDSDFEDIPENVEIVHDEVNYIFGEGFSSRSKLNSVRTGRSSVRTSKELKSGAEKLSSGRKPAKDSSAKEILPQMSTALDKFDKQVSEAELNDILGSKFPELYGKSNSSSQGGTSSQSISARAGRANVQANPSKKTKMKRNNSMPADRKEPTPRIRPRARHPSISESIDPETDEMIAEILKSTPNPSLSLGSVRNSGKGEVERGMSRQEFEDIMNNGGQKSFREVQGAGVRKQGSPRKNSDSDGQLTARQLLNEPYQGEDDIVRMVRNRSNAELQELMAWKNKVDDLNELEKKQLDKLLNTVRNLGLKVGSGKNQVTSSKKSGLAAEMGEKKLDDDGEEVRGKPPIQPGTKPSEKHVLAKSPRFVRKKESFRAASLDKDEVFESKLPMDSMSSFGSVNIPSLDTDLVDDRSVVVTSRLGRRSAASSRATVTSEDGDTIQWKRGNILGKGAYGVVWCGLTNHGGLIAVKQIELNIADMERTELEYEKIQQEVELLKTLKHENIVGYLGTSLEDNIVSIFMQFVPGGSIANVLARFGALEEEVFSNYTQQILQGVEYLHANSVIHRDIKGGNIMLMHNGVIKLIDFGCAKRLCLNVSTKVTEQSKNRLLKSMRGTPYWMAPEVVKETGYGTSSDIWSIGCTVHEMATRKPPWADMPQMTAIFNIGNDSKPVPELPDNLSPESRDFARQCMTRDPNKRPSASQLLQHAFMRRRRKSRSNSFANATEMR